MTKLIAGLSLVSTLVCGGLLALLIVAVRTPLLASVCALPCIQAITPGVDTRGEAMEAFQKSGGSFGLGTVTEPESIIHHSAQDKAVMVRVDFGSRTGNRVQSVRMYSLAVQHDLGALGDFLLAGNQPTRVLAACADPDSLVLILGNAAGYIQVDAGAQLEPRDRIMLLASTADLDTFQGSVSAFACTLERPWLGFTAQWKYQRAL